MYNTHKRKCFHSSFVWKKDSDFEILVLAISVLFRQDVGHSKHYSSTDFVCVHTFLTLIFIEILEMT